MCYENGHGVEMDISKALSWFNKAANQGNDFALFNLGFLYEKGIGVEKNEKKAFSLFKQSAEKGYPQAQRKLAHCYYFGTGTAKDIDTAIYWMNKAKENGDKIAGELLESLYVIKRSPSEMPSDISYRNNETTTTIIMNKIGYVYYVPCKINGLKEDFIFDTGAGMISLSSSFASQLIEAGRLSENDIVGKADSRVADGRISQVLVANIKDVEIGGMHLYNVKATIKEQQNAPLLFGQSAIEKLGKVTIDGYKLIIHRK